MPRMLSLKEDKNDDSALRHGYTVHEGHDMGTVELGTYKYGQSVPLFFNREGATVSIDGMYRGCPAFLVASGPSLATVDISKLYMPGVLTLGMNNSAKVVRPNIWTCVDDPCRFLYSIWKDPRIMKLVPMSHFQKPIWMSTVVDGVQKWEQAPEMVGDCPNVFGFRRNEKFCADRFLTENTVNWGCHKDFGGCRSVMLAALRMMFALGIRRVFLVGCDLKMTETSTYAFKEGRSPGSVKGNTNTYNRMMTEYFPSLKPHFDKFGFEVFNCNPESELKVFPHIPFEDAVRTCCSGFGDVLLEKTEGMYLTMKEKVHHGSWENCCRATKVVTE